MMFNSVSHLGYGAASFFQLLAVPLREIDVGGGGAFRCWHAVLVHLGLLVFLIVAITVVALVALLVVMTATAAVMIRVILLLLLLLLLWLMVRHLLWLHVLVHHLLPGVHLAEMMLLTGVCQTAGHDSQIEACCREHRYLRHGRM